MSDKAKGARKPGFYWARKNRPLKDVVVAQWSEIVKRWFWPGEALSVVDDVVEVLSDRLTPPKKRGAPNAK